MILQLPIPGGPELIILLLVLVVGVLFVAAPAVIAVLVYRWWSGDGDDEAEVAELRARVAELEKRVDDGGGGRRPDDELEADDR